MKTSEIEMKCYYKATLPKTKVLGSTSFSHPSPLIPLLSKVAVNANTLLELYFV